MKKIILGIITLVSTSGVYADGTNSFWIRVREVNKELLGGTNGVSDSVMAFADQATLKGISRKQTSFDLSFEAMTVITEAKWNLVTKELAEASEELIRLRALDGISTPNQRVITAAQQRLLKAQGDYDAVKEIRSHILEESRKEMDKIYQKYDKRRYRQNSQDSSGSEVTHSPAAKDAHDDQPNAEVERLSPPVENK